MNGGMINEGESGSGVSYRHPIGIRLWGLAKIKIFSEKVIVDVEIRTLHLQNARQRIHHQNQLCSVGRRIMLLNKQTVNVRTYNVTWRRVLATVLTVEKQ